MKCTIRTFLESRVGVLEHSQLFPGFDSLTRVSQSTQKIAKNAPQALQGRRCELDTSTCTPPVRFRRSTAKSSCISAVALATIPHFGMGDP